MKKLFTFIIIITSVLFASAQILDYPLADYKQPVLEFKTLSFDPQSNGRYDKPTYGEDYSSFSFHLRPWYTSFKVSETRQSILSANINTVIERRSEDTPSQFDGNYAYMWFYVSYSHRQFFKDDLFFYIEPESRAFLSSSEELIFFTNDHFSLDLPLGIGKGRIEFINSAFHAMNLLQNLSDKSLLDRSPTHEEITRLGQEIGRINNTRVLDFRMNRIAQLERLTAYLENEGLVNSSIPYFAVLNDAWSFENYYQRRSGKAWSVGIRPDVRKDREGDSNDFQNIWLEGRFEHFNPINLYWQLNQTYRVGVGTGRADEERQLSGYLLDNINEDLAINVRADVELAYLFNSRSYASFSLRAFQQNNTNEEMSYLNVRADLNYVKWFSPRVRLNGSIGYGRTQVDNGPEFLSQIQVEKWSGLTYHIYLQYFII